MTLTFLNAMTVQNVIDKMIILRHVKDCPMTETMVDFQIFGFDGSKRSSSGRTRFRKRFGTCDGGAKVRPHSRTGKRMRPHDTLRIRIERQQTSLYRLSIGNLQVSNISICKLHEQLAQVAAETFSKDNICILF
jgi:hypothetical protein